MSEILIDKMYVEALVLYLENNKYPTSDPMWSTLHRGFDMALKVNGREEKPRARQPSNMNMCDEATRILLIEPKLIQRAEEAEKKVTEKEGHIKLLLDHNERMVHSNNKFLERVSTRITELEAEVDLLKESVHLSNGAMKHRDGAETELRELRERVEKVISDRRENGWEGFRNVMYGWCISKSQVDAFLDELQAALKGEQE